MPEPLLGQAYNRYSYVLNNPLRYTDPSGFLPDEWLTEPRAQRAPEAANHADSRPPPVDEVTKNKRKPGTTNEPEAGQPAANGEASDSEGHSAASGATAQPTTASRVAGIAGSLLLRGARNTPITGLVIRIAEAVGEEVAETKQDDPITIGEIAALYAVKDAVNKPFGIIEGTALDIATVGDDVRAVGNADSVEDKIEAGLDAAEKIARIATVAYGGAKGVQGMVQAAEERPGAAGGAKATTPYKRPSGATTPAQRASVQGKPCVDCGAVTPTQVADHKTPLVREYYETGTIDKGRMRSLDAVQPQCPTCSARQGAEMSRYSPGPKRAIEEQMATSSSVSAEQEAVCRRHGVSCDSPGTGMKVGIARNVRDGILPINGLRHPPVGDTSGWYIWAGEGEPSEDPDFFVPLHVAHLSEWCRRYSFSRPS